MGPLGVNCYILHDGNGKGVVVDPGDEGAQIMATVKRLGIEVTHIINTHGHFDHIGANGHIKEATGASLLIHSGDADMLDRADVAAARFGLKADPSPETLVKLPGSKEDHLENDKPRRTKRKARP